MCLCGCLHVCNEIINCRYGVRIQREIHYTPSKRESDVTAKFAAKIKILINLKLGKNHNSHSSYALII